MPVVPGTKLQVIYDHPQIGQIPIANATDFELEFEGDIVDRTNKDSNGWSDSFIGVRNWTISTTALYENFKFAGFMDIFQHQLETRNDVYLKFTVNQSTSGKDYRGNAFIVSMNLIGETEEGAKYQAFFSGTKHLSEYNI